MKIYSEILGNTSSSEWRHKLEQCNVEYLTIDQWNAQRSRTVIEREGGERVAITMPRGKMLADGDIVEYDRGSKRALVITVEMNDVMVVDLHALAGLSPEQLMRRCIEIGHAIGNQHWAAMVRDQKIYIPLTVDKRVMASVMETHNFEDVTFTFAHATEVLPLLSPHDQRLLFGATPATQEHQARPMHCKV